MIFLVSDCKYHPKACSDLDRLFNSDGGDYWRLRDSKTN